MKYKILLTGNNKTIIDDLFSKASNRFDFQTTSTRYEDLLCHMKYFQPDGFLYCINHGIPESFLRMSELKHAPESANTAFFAIGTRADCDAYTRTAPDVVDLVMEKPMTTSNIEAKMSAYLSSRTKPQMAASFNAAATAAPTANTANTANTIPGNIAALNRPQAAANAAPQANNAGQFAGKPQSNNMAQAGTPPIPPANYQPAAPAPVPPMPDNSGDANDELLMALMEQIDEADKMLDNVSDLNLEEDAKAAAPERGHVLVIDDDSRMLKVIKRHLADKYDVATALNGKVAMKFLENKRTDLILLDYEMPIESGPAVLKKLRENPHTSNIPVIFLTGISERGMIEKALSLKPQGYLLKPIDHIKLLSTISKFIG